MALKSKAASVASASSGARSKRSGRGKAGGGTSQGTRRPLPRRVAPRPVPKPAAGSSPRGSDGARGVVVKRAMEQQKGGKAADSKVYKTNALSPDTLCAKCEVSFQSVCFCYYLFLVMFIIYYYVDI